MPTPQPLPIAMGASRPLLPWPLPALAVWAAAWAVSGAVSALGGQAAPALLAGGLTGALLAWPLRLRWRRLIAAGGFPLSALLVGGTAALPAWIWLLAGLPLALLYPLRAWRDAPFFPTPADALDDLGPLLLPAPRQLLDAGCGLGHGLVALRRVWPQARLHGLEWSRTLAWIGARRCRWAQVRQADMWAADWSAHDLVYLFQRPESMARAYAKARSEMAAGGWLVSLEFAVPDVQPWACVERAGRRTLWIYRCGAAAGKQHSTGHGTGR